MKEREIKIIGYRRTVNGCMAAMVVLAVLMEVFTLLRSLTSYILAPAVDLTTYEVIMSLESAALYMCMFILPISAFRLSTRKGTYYPLPASPTLPKHPVKITLAAVSIIYSAARINSLLVNYLVSFFGYSPDTSVFNSTINGAHSVVLIFISSAIVPALCEEFLFRGVMLKNLMPYGKTVAVVISALMFSLMHQNFYQFFFAFIAGLVLGYVFLMTGSVWCGVLIHFVNNFLGVLTEVTSHYLSDEAGLAVDSIIMGIVTLSGVLSIISLLKCADKEGEKKLKVGSVYGRTERLSVFDSDLKLKEREAVKNFFTPFTIFVLALMLVYAFFTLSQMVVPLPPIDVSGLE